ncbi:MAG: TIGR01777 family oxidoreductase [Thermoanaerobaculia bacterium]
MKIVISGGTGFLGGPLVKRLQSRGDIVVLTRKPAQLSGARAVEWHPPQSGPWTREVSGADVVINLAGENVGEGRWTEERKRRLESSRLDATAALVSAMPTGPAKKRTFISASAVGFYGSDRGDEVLDESSMRGNDFLSGLTEKWEAAAREAEPIARLVIARLGVVLGKDGGALAKMLLPFKLGAGGRIGSGGQWMSWIDRDDVLRFLEWAIDDEHVRGVYNVTSPEPVRNRDFVRALGRALHRPTILPVPSFALRLLFGEMANETVLGGQRVLPKRAMSEGFQFTHPEIGEALEQELR